MNRDDANQLAKRICNAMRTTTPHAEWADYLVGLDDHQRATNVFERLRGREEFAPSFKRFSDEYRALAFLAKPAPEATETEPRLTREQRLELLIAGGAPRKIVDRSGLDIAVKLHPSNSKAGG